jgi:hypothetical protein
MRSLIITYLFSYHLPITLRGRLENKIYVEVLEKS